MDGPRPSSGGGESELNPTAEDPYMRCAGGCGRILLIHLSISNPLMSHEGERLGGAYCIGTEGTDSAWNSRRLDR